MTSRPRASSTTPRSWSVFSGNRVNSFTPPCRHSTEKSSRWPRCTSGRKQSSPSPSKPTPTSSRLSHPTHPNGKCPTNSKLDSAPPSQSYAVAAHDPRRPDDRPREETGPRGPRRQRGKSATSTTAAPAPGRRATDSTNANRAAWLGMARRHAQRRNRGLVQEAVE